MKGQIQQYLTRTVFILANILFVFFFFQLFVLDIGKVNGQSMEPRLKDSQIFFVNRGVFLYRQPQRYELVQFFRGEELDSKNVKRVVGLPGETISIKRGRIYITPQDGEEFLLEEQYIESEMLTSVKPNLPTSYEIPEHSYFVVGDNRIFSGDSREYGPVHRQHITGKVLAL